jgi:glucose-6-phosphate 1-epimerase
MYEGSKMVAQKQLENGFEYLDITNESASAKIALQGGHIFHYAHHNKEPLLWLSEVSDFKIGKAIRGGVPICWPWFGMSENPELPQHGFARTSIWKFHSSEEIDDKTTEVILTLKHSKSSLELWPYHFELALHVRISDTLSMELKTKNLDEKPFKITQALHSYFQVSHISNISIEGLDKSIYYDALTQERYQQNGDIRFNQEIDRIYQKLSETITLVDTKRQVLIENEGSSSAIIWNPWIEKCARMSAMNDDAYLTMVCIESANALDDIQTIMPNQSHTLKARISIKDKSC